MDCPDRPCSGASLDNQAQTVAPAIGPALHRFAGKRQGMGLMCFANGRLTERQGGDDRLKAEAGAEATSTVAMPAAPDSEAVRQAPRPAAAARKPDAVALPDREGSVEGAAVEDPRG